MSGSTARMFACAADLFARSLKLRYDGTAIASRMPRMMMTTRSSIRVKPCSELRRAFRRAFMVLQTPFGSIGVDLRLAIHRDPAYLRHTPERGRSSPRNHPHELPRARRLDRCREGRDVVRPVVA